MRTVCFSFTLVFLLVLSGCGGGSALQPLAITVTVTAAGASLQAGGTVQVTATVANDPANKGVTWTVTCSAMQCGSVSPTTTSSGSATTYTAPSIPPASDLTVTITATSASDSTKTGTTTIKVLAITVSISPTSANAVVSATQQFTATVTNDPGSKGVTWTLTQSGVACSPACGSVSPASGTGNTPSTIYTAPATVPSPAMVTITATSVADPTKSASATITVTLPPPISVSVFPINPGVAINATQQFTATVTNDPGSKGVTWTLTQSGVACSPACGSVSPASGTGNTPSTIYTAPATVPSPAMVTITATSVADPTKSASTTITVSVCGSGNESVFNGQYAFLFQGFDANGPVAVAGTFSADGTGRIALLVGVEDINNSAGVQMNVPINSAASFYSVGADNRGCLTIATASSTSTYRFSLGSILSGVATKGRMIEFDNKGALGSGVLRLQDQTAFVNSAISGGYAFGASSALSLSLTARNRFAVVGTFTADGAGGITAGEMDSNNSGTVDGGTAGPLLMQSTSTYSVAPNGRATFTLNFAGSSNPLHGIFYPVSGSEALTMSADPQSGAGSNSLFAGLVLKQSGVPFAASSLNGNSVFYTAGLCAGCGPPTAPIAPNLTAGVFTVPTAGNFSLTEDINDGGTLSTQTVTGTYSVDPSGRVLLTQTSQTTPFIIIYLVSPGQGLVATTDASVEAGFVEPQVGVLFSNTSVSGTYFFGTTNQVNQNVSDSSGMANFDVRAGFTGTRDSASIGPTPSTPNLNSSQTFNNTYILTNRTATPGRGTINMGTTTNFIFYIISHHCVVTCTSKLVLMDATANTNPALTIAETR